ncbi:unnamed protein product [Lactuca virosa]|uniref:Uncharacterized protein n=1 Tax=Lactuca virosa TaxID=75947 RepID=A0AAU9M9T3_9ASTR|nr:unnamed protein product [Lactuca virosa]
MTTSDQSRIFKNYIPYLLHGKKIKDDFLNTSVQDLGTVLDTAKSLIFSLPLLAAAHQQFLEGCRHADATGLDGLKVQIILSSICYQPCLFMSEFSNPISVDVSEKQDKLGDGDYYHDMSYLVPYSTYQKLPPDVEGDGNESNSTISSESDVNGVVIEESQSQNNKISEMRMLGC